MANVSIEIGHLLRPHRAGVAHYIASLVNAMISQNRDIQGAARWRRLPGWVLRPKHLPVRFFGASPPRVRPRVFHATASVFPEWKSPLEIATVHDLYRFQPCFNLPATELRRRARYIERADRIICVSDFTRLQLHSVLDIPESRTVTIPLAPAEHFKPANLASKSDLCRRLQLPSEFLLFVGRDRANKNLDRLTRAYAASNLTMPLCFVGNTSRHTRRRLLQIMRENRGDGSLRWLGEIRDPDMPVLLSCASALCMPSLFEGFGLPIIEAMACGTPVLTSAGRATEETSGGKAILVDPESVDSIREGLSLVLAMTDEQCADAHAYAIQRSWNDVANDTWKVYEN